jgi:hypothetical protein
MTNSQDYRRQNMSRYGARGGRVFVTQFLKAGPQNDHAICQIQEPRACGHKIKPTPTLTSFAVASIQFYRQYIIRFLGEELM